MTASRSQRTQEFQQHWSEQVTQLRIPAVYMRGGTSKGVFFHQYDLPKDRSVRNAVLLRVIGSPDAYGKHIDGLGGATSSTSKVALISKSSRADCDVDYYYGAVSIDKPAIDWSGNCGNLTSAVGPFAITEGLVEAPADGSAMVRIWQANLGQRIVAHVEMRNGAVAEDGLFELDGVAFPGSEVMLDFLNPGGDSGGTMFPTGKPIDAFEVPGVGKVEATLINAGNPTIFVEAHVLGLTGIEMQREVNADPELLSRAEGIRAHAAVRMGLAASAEEATCSRPHTPKLAFVSKPKDYFASNGKQVAAKDVDVVARIFSMGQLHHAMTGTGAVAIAAAAAVPGTLLSRLLGDKLHPSIRFGHPSGTLTVGAQASHVGDSWMVNKATMSRSARRLMEGTVFVPASITSNR
ncbi:2-methylaconitate cis-trans isomerase PrpF [Cupriavidus taiwanensis]|uniref:2-methylaconitate cis-trans isomerase PrpF n=1 Tax=Cupriavidus taiwanensis TaxID=164546 RepID=UPI001558DDB6|nr:2-methylaconitate cis-trans isomerase PrpF [Cupriavidus taiwanensis]